jgi:hypothetical protein
MIIEVQTLDNNGQLKTIYVVGEHIFSSREEAENFIQNYEGPTD